MNILHFLKQSIRYSASSMPASKAGKIIIFCLVLLLPFLVQAQPTLTLSGMIPQAGSTFRYYDSHYGYDTSFPQRGGAGANQLWDFSRYTTAGTNSLTYDSCGSSLCFTTTNQFGYRRQYSADGNAISLWSAYCDANRMYSEGDDLFRFPMTFNSKYVDSFHADGIINYPQILIFKMAGTDSVEADAWGTLITPAGTYTNTLRVKRVQIFREVTNPPTGYGNYMVITYTWYSMNNPNFLYYISQYYPASGSSICENTMYAYPGNSLGIGNQQKQDITWSISPNPAKEAANLLINLSLSARVNATIIDLTGQQLIQIPEMTLLKGSNTFLINTSLLPEGMYWVRLNIGGLVTTKKLVIR